MSRITRRDFLAGSAAVLGTAAGVSTSALAADSDAVAGPGAPIATSRAASTSPAGTVLHAHDIVTLGNTGLKPSRLAIGTGTRSGTEQRAAGLDNFVRMLRHGLERGIRWWETADSYETHSFIRPALKEVKRDEIILTSKTRAKDAASVRADMERFRKELGTDYIDIVLLHCMMDGKWPEKLRGAMDALSEAKQKGQVRAVGCSCHTFEALQAAANEPWVEVDLARINPFGRIMDVEKPEGVPKVVQTLQTMKDRGKAVYGMKILGEGAFKGEQIDKSLEFALNQRFLSGFTIGFSNAEQIDDIIRRIDRLAVKA
jgi:aryl-alcohol dehydrogenase-like predicted oxidoreductase